MPLLCPQPSGHIEVVCAGRQLTAERIQPFSTSTHLQQRQLSQQGCGAVKGLLDDCAEHDFQVSHSSLEFGKILKPARSLYIKDILVALCSSQRLEQLLEGSLHPKTGVIAWQHGRWSDVSYCYPEHGSGEILVAWVLKSSLSINQHDDSSAIHVGT